MTQDLAQCAAKAKRPGACNKLQANLQALRARMAGERAKCLTGARIERKGVVITARAERAASKTEVATQLEARRQARLATGMQRQEYKMAQVQLRAARREAGETGQGIKAAGLLAAAAAAAFLL